MAARTSIPLFPFFIFLFFSISPLTSHCFKITTQLIHRDSHLSPLYNASLTAADRAGRIVESSLARRAYLSAVNDDEPEDSIVGGIEARLVWGTKYNIFYVRFSIGQPPVKQLALLDTGSDLLWLKCPPCSPCPVDSGATFFYSFESKTYSPRPCTTACKKCTDYLGGQTSEGVYATDQLVFGTTDGRCTVVPKVLFGCCSKLTGPNVLDGQVNGVLGLAGGSYSSLPRGEESIVTRLGSKFSYCVGSLADVTYPHNRLSFGDAVDLVGDWTPLYLDHGNYYVQMFGISLGGKVKK
ncbi:unnamed protein product [Linum tenue]|uniref:Peptidase A1 domain-containing protein n=1 Tax=Linum tenue TaxID=586396 RepID=A0AAV0IEK5_9ROSI|nr:unnamed protein product [Linum tenue]